MILSEFTCGDFRFVINYLHTIPRYLPGIFLVSLYAPIQEVTKPGRNPQKIDCGTALIYYLFREYMCFLF